MVIDEKPSLVYLVAPAMIMGLGVLTAVMARTWRDRSLQSYASYPDWLRRLMLVGILESRLYLPMMRVMGAIVVLMGLALLVIMIQTYVQAH